MKKRLFVVMLSGVMASGLQATQCQKVVASAHPAYPPYHWNQDGEIVGASVDLHRKIFAELGVDFSSPYQGPWKRVLMSAKQGQIDLVMALKKTPERQQFLAFTEHPIFPNPFSVFVSAERTFSFEQWADLKGKRGGKNSGDRYGKRFDDYAREQLKIEPANTPELNFRKLLAGRIDYFIHSRYSGAIYLQTHAQGDKVAILKNNINEGYIHSGFSKQSSCKELLPYINKRYAELVADGTAERLLEQNLQRWRASKAGS